MASAVVPIMVSAQGVMRKPATIKKAPMSTARVMAVWTLLCTRSTRRAP